MSPTEVALAVRPGEHACCRVAEAADREQLTHAFVRAGLRRGHRVVHFVDRDGVDLSPAPAPIARRDDDPGIERLAS